MLCNVQLGQSAINSVGRLAMDAKGLDSSPVLHMNVSQGELLLAELRLYYVLTILVHYFSLL